jgi:oxygen-dependent protoporphyrinogen oxidase
MPFHIVILGAGISGLATGWFLKQALGEQIRLTLIEKNPRAGGWIQTIQTEGFLFEQGARSCRTKGVGQETLALIEALELQDQVLVPHPDAGNRYLYTTGGLQRLPRRIWEIPFNPLTKGWIKALWRDWRMPKCQVEDESIEAFFSRRLGQPWVKQLIDPFVSGIYAGDCRRLSLRSCFPLFHQWEQQRGSLLRGAWSHRAAPLFPSSFIQSIRRFPLFSFKQGMESLPRTLAEALKDCLLLNQTVKRLAFDAAGVEVQLANGMPIRANHVISTLPTSALSSLLSSTPDLADKLNELTYATVFVVNLGFRASVLPFKGFGYLIPSHLNLPVLGCVWDSSIFPQQNLEANQTRLTVMMGGRHHPEVEQMSEQEIVECALCTVSQHLGIRATPQVAQVKKAQRAIPQYEIGYALWKKVVQETVHLLFPRLILSGSAWTGVSINDCIAQARQLAQHMANRLERFQL